MKAILINKSDATGGAAVVSARLLDALRREGVDARMLVAEKRHDSPFVELAASRPQIHQAFLTDRLKIFMANGLNRDTLFKIDTASDGLPLHRNRYVREADVICLNWVNQGMLSLDGLKKLMELGKPIVWTMHDMWCMTGICHHAYDCRRYIERCGDCPLMGAKASPTDLSNKIWLQKSKVYASGSSLHFVPVSHWLESKARESSLLRNAPMTVIPNAFPFDGTPVRHRASRPLKIVFGAARLDDPIKGLPILIEATKTLRGMNPQLAGQVELVTFGGIRNASLLERIAIPHRHLGVVSGMENIRRVYEDCRAVVSASSWETLPGTLVEGEAWGAIPVAFDRGGQSDIVTHLHTGYLAEWSDDPVEAGRRLAVGIIWALESWSPEMCDKMLHEAQKKFGARQVALQYISLFESLLR